MARKKLELSQDQLVQIQRMAGLGLKVEQMAALLNMSKKTFERRMEDTPGASDALEKGRSAAAENVTQTAYKLAVGGKYPAMTMFWLKCRERWKETTAHELSGPDGKPIEAKSVNTLSDEQIEARIQKLLGKDRLE